jgi:hypothetical protein
MIQRRLAERLHAQDWVAVIIEFVIVVAGIFVALQATQWHEARQQRERELVYLTRLSEDLAAMRSNFDEILVRADRSPSRALRTFRALEACDPTLATDEDIRGALALYQNQPSVPALERTYQEMLASGALASMEDAALSAAIAGLFGELDNYRSAAAGFRISLPVVDAILWRHVDLSYDADGVPTLSDFDFAAACASREMRNAVWEIYDLFWDWRESTVRMSRRVDEVSVQLDTYLSERGP